MPKKVIKRNLVIIDYLTFGTLRARLIWYATFSNLKKVFLYSIQRQIYVLHIYVIKTYNKFYRVDVNWNSLSSIKTINFFKVRSYSNLYESSKNKR